MLNLRFYSCKCIAEFAAQDVASKRKTFNQHKFRTWPSVGDNSSFIMQLNSNGVAVAAKQTFSIRSTPKFELTVDENYLAVIWQSAQEDSVYILLRISHRGKFPSKSLKCAICAAKFVTLLKLVKHYDDRACAHRECK